MVVITWQPENGLMHCCFVLSQGDNTKNVIYKTKGFNFRFEMKNSQALPLGKKGIFQILNPSLTWFNSDTRRCISRWTKVKGWKCVSCCFMGEKVKQSVNWILLSKSSQQDFLSKWIALGWFSCVSFGHSSCPEHCAWTDVLIPMWLVSVLSIVQ